MIELNSGKRIDIEIPEGVSKDEVKAKLISNGLAEESDFYPIGTELGGVGEAVLTVASPVTGKIAAGYAGLVTKIAEGLGLADEGAAVKVIEDWQEAATYQPTTQIGKRKVEEFLSNPMMQFVGNAINQLNVEVKGFGEDITDVTGSPMLATAVTSPMLAMPDAVGTASGIGALANIPKGAITLGKLGKQQLPQGAEKRQMGKDLATGQINADSAGYQLVEPKVRELAREDFSDVPQYVEGVTDAVDESGKAVHVDNVTSEMPTTDLTNRNLRVTKYPEGKRLLKQGFEAKDVADFQAMTKDEAKIAANMARLKAAALGSNAVDRLPLSSVGEAVQNQVMILQRERLRASKEVGKALREMEGKDIDFSSQQSDFSDYLKKQGIVISKDGKGGSKIDFSDSKHASDAGAQSLIQTVQDRFDLIARQNGNTGLATAEQVHKFKKLIDYQIDWGKLPSDKMLTGQSSHLVTGLRGSLNKLLQDGSSNYKKANQDYAAAIAPIVKLNKATNAKIDVLDDKLTASKLGTEMRKMTGNWAATEDIKAAARLLSKKAKDLGYDKNVNLYKLVILDGVLDKRFGVSEAKAKSFSGSIEQAIRGDKFGAAKELSEKAKRKADKINDKEAAKDLILLLDKQGKQ